MTQIGDFRSNYLTSLGFDVNTNRKDVLPKYWAVFDVIDKNKDGILQDSEIQVPDKHKDGILQKSEIQVPDKHSLSVGKGLASVAADLAKQKQKDFFEKVGNHLRTSR